MFLMKYSVNWKDEGKTLESGAQECDEKDENTFESGFFPTWLTN